MAHNVILRHNLLEVSPEGLYRIQVWVSEYSTGTDPNIFVYQRYPMVPSDTTIQDQFVNVASAADLVEYPSTTPVAGSPFFRKSSLDLEFKSVDKLRTFWRQVQDHVNSLMNNLNRLDDATQATTTTITV